MSRYQPAFEDRFVRNQRRYHGLRKQIQRHVDQILDDPYTFFPLSCGKRR